MDDLTFFQVNSSEYVAGTDYWISHPASINHPKDHSVMFISKQYPAYRQVFFAVVHCLIFWPQEWEIPEELARKHAIVPCKNPRVAYCSFFKEQGITGLCVPDEVENVQGAWIAKTAKIGQHTVIFPGVYIGGEVTIGDDCYIGTGVKIIGRVRIGNRVRIRENTVIGTDGLSTDRDDDGHPMTMPQFGGIIIEDEVQIGANTVVQRGAIDDTILHRGCKIDGQTFISHNVVIGEETFIVGESFLLGSASVGMQAQIAAGSTLGNYVHVGDRTLLGMASLATRDIPENVVAYGSPAKPVRKHYEETEA